MNEKQVVQVDDEDGLSGCITGMVLVIILLAGIWVGQHLAIE